eukprot:gene20870-biopygen15392
MQQNYQDAMTIVRKHGKTDIFLTFTANPSWQEILENLLPNQKPQDRPDIVTRVFNLKFKQLLCDILDLNLFGKVIAYVYTVEFQKRGLPHTHMILSLADQDKPRTPEHIDRIISAEIPDQNTHTREHHIAKKHMMHGPCGILNPSCICMQDGKCTKKFPKDLAQQTEVNVNGYPLYRRREKEQPPSKTFEQLTESLTTRSKNAARAMSLLEDDAEHRRCLQDAAVINMLAHMRQLFATLILFQTPSNINDLFTEFQEDMADDYVRHDQLQDSNTTFQQQHIHMCLADIQNNLHIHGKSLQDFPEMPQLPADYAQPQQPADEINIKQEREQGQQML